jgi:hypothetical protein
MEIDDAEVTVAGRPTKRGADSDHFLITPVGEGVDVPSWDVRDERHRAGLLAPGSSDPLRLPVRARPRSSVANSGYGV